MTIIRDRADARWLPSRFNFAVFRLFAYLRLRAARPEPHPGLMLSKDRHQSAAENYIVCIVMMVVVASMFDSLAVGIAVAIIGPQVAIPLSGLVMRFEAGSWMMLIIIIAVAAYQSRTSPIACVFLGFVAVNAIAAAIMFALRGSVARLERQFE